MLFSSTRFDNSISFFQSTSSTIGAALRAGAIGHHVPFCSVSLDDLKLCGLAAAAMIEENPAHANT